MFLYNYFFNSDFTIYGRNKSDDAYNLLFQVDKGNPMSRFKHEVYAYALRKKHKTQKSLYLYCGNYRVAKCLMESKRDTPYLTLTFQASNYADDWDRVREQIPEVYTDMIWLENTFKGHWVLQLSDSPYERVYQNYTLSATI